MEFISLIFVEVIGTALEKKHKKEAGTKVSDTTRILLI
jgi:hypothetical protein